MDTAKKKAIIVELSTSEVFHFVKYSNSLHFFDTDSPNYNTKIKNTINDYISDQTVSTNT